ncbi:Zinc/iron permease [Phellopilus nigrolimitatus]|nr:Zinc/iron permease [Phellopilus nigrolimitatus]
MFFDASQVELTGTQLRLEGNNVDRDVTQKIIAMLSISVLSLFASTFPTLSKRVSFLRIPHTIFFILKHFGTGVILSTAFVHLLQDAFETLLSLPPGSNVKHWVGLLVLGSLFSIFLVEYVSMTYVEHLEKTGSEHAHEHGHHNRLGHGYEHEPALEHHHHFPPPALERTTSSDSERQIKSHDGTHKPHILHPHVKHPHAPLSPLQEAICETNGVEPELGNNAESAPLPVSERTSLLRSTSTPAHLQRPYAHSQQHQPRPLSRASYGSPSPHSNHSVLPTIPVTDAESPYFSGHHRYELPGAHATHSARVRRTPSIETLALAHADHAAGTGTGRADYFPVDAPLLRADSAHSLHRGHHSQHTHEHHHDERSDDADLEWNANGEARSYHSSDPDDDPEEQLEPLSPQAQPHSHVHGHGHENVPDAGKRRQIVSTLVLQTGIMVHSLVIGLTLSIKSGPEFTSLVIAILFHQLFEGLSLGVRLAALPRASRLTPVLAAIFAATVPAGILLGRATLSHGRPGDTMKRTQGLMSAFSAGMLVYAACVEMLAADFVLDPQLKRSSVGRQVLAIGSLIAGAGAMAALGYD